MDEPWNKLKRTTNPLGSGLLTFITVFLNTFVSLKLQVFFKDIWIWRRKVLFEKIATFRKIGIFSKYSFWWK